jgi:hypothetical protein
MNDSRTKGSICAKTVPAGGLTLRGLINAYQTDPDSRHHKKRYATRRNHDTLLKRLVEGHGEVKLCDIKGRTIIGWHKEWSDNGRMLATGQAMKGIIRVLFSFGFTILEDAECQRLCSVMGELRFAMPYARLQSITADQAIAVRKTAREWFGWDSMALAQALQFELMLRQKDVIGEWVPLSEPEQSVVVWHGQKWIRGLRWEAIDDNFILIHTTSKRMKTLEVNLRLAPMVMEELGLMLEIEPDQITRNMLPAAGPVILNTISAMPYSSCEYRRKWRKVATKAGVPKNVYNMDSRAGGITEASDAGAEMEHIRHAATHSHISMTQRYSRNSADKVAKVMRIRAASRRNKVPENGM